MMMMMMSLAPTGKNPDDIPTFTSGIKVNGSTASQPEPWQETDSIEEDDDDGIDPQEPDSRTVLNGVLGHVVNQLKQHEDSLLYLISEGANNTSYTAKEYQDYLKDYVVNGIGWEAPEEDKQAYATRAIYKELPNAMAADTTNKTFSAAAKAFLGRPIEIPTGAFVLPAATQAATAPTTVVRGTTPHNNPQYGGKIESKVGNATGNGGVQRFVAPKVSVPKPRYELYNPFSAEQQERELIDGLVKGFHRMQDRWYNPPVEQDRAMVLAEIDAKRPVRIASNDNIGFDVPPQNNMLLASAETPKTPSSTKLRGVYDPKYYDVVEQTGKESRVKIITVDNSSDFNTLNRVLKHSVIVVDGTAYNMSPDGFHKISYGDYLKSITNQKGGKPSQGAIIQDVRVSNVEVERMKAELNKPQGKFNPVTNNCSMVSARALGAGIGASQRFKDMGGFTTPNALQADLSYSGRIIGKTVIKPNKQ